MWTFLSLLLRSQRAVMGVSMMILMPLVFGSNIFADPATMPGWLQAWVGVNPVAHVVDAVRGLMDGAASAGDIVWVMGWSGVLVAVFGTLTMWRYRDPR